MAGCGLSAAGASVKQCGSRVAERDFVLKLQAYAVSPAQSGSIPSPVSPKATHQRLEVRIVLQHALLGPDVDQIIQACCHSVYRPSCLSRRDGGCK